MISSIMLEDGFRGFFVAAILLATLFGILIGRHAIDRRSFWIRIVLVFITALVSWIALIEAAQNFGLTHKDRIWAEGDIKVTVIWSIYAKLLILTWYSVLSFACGYLIARRLVDVGWSRWLTWLAYLLGPLLIVVVGFAPSRARSLPPREAEETFR